MFDMKKIGRKIVELRKKEDLTQMELADKLSISYQAVSNWERGLTMPDVTKLPELAQIFNISIDCLLDHSKEAQVVEEVINNSIIKNMEDTISADVFHSLTSILKPAQLKECSSELSVDEDTDIEMLLDFLPFMSTEAADKVIEKAIKDKVDPMRLIDCCIPFISREKSNQLVILALDTDSDIKHLITKVLPFISRSIADTLAKKALAEEMSINFLLKHMMPFISKDVVDCIVNKAL